MEDHNKVCYPVMNERDIAAAVEHGWVALLFRAAHPF